MIVLDTNVVSELMRQFPDGKVAAWLDRQPQSSIWTTSITLFEVRFGLQIMPVGRKRSALAMVFEGFLDKINQRVVSFDVTAAHRAADLAAVRKSKGRPVESRDTMIAGIILAHNATLATRNNSYFEEISTIINPWAA
jgi:predicted nucleic acid-binding protein